MLAAADVPNGNAKNRFNKLQNITWALNYSLIFIDPIRIELISKQNTSTNIGNATVKQWEKYRFILIVNDYIENSGIKLIFLLLAKGIAIKKRETKAMLVDRMIPVNPISIKSTKITQQMS